MNHSFKRYIANEIGKPMGFDNHHHTNISKVLNIPNIESAKEYINFVFLFKLFGNHINCIELSGEFPVHAPTRV